jgi:hypothetical protein
MRPTGPVAAATTKTAPATTKTQLWMERKRTMCERSSSMAHSGMTAICTTAGMELVMRMLLK